MEQAQGDEDGGEDPKGLCRCHWEVREKKKSLAKIRGLVQVPLHWEARENKSLATTRGLVQVPGSRGWQRVLGKTVIF